MTIYNNKIIPFIKVLIVKKIVINQVIFINKKVNTFYKNNIIKYQVIYFDQLSKFYFTHKDNFHILI